MTWLAVLTGTVVALHRLGSFLPPPPASPSELGAWLDAQGALVAVSSVLRLAALAVAASLLATTTLGAISHLLGNARAIRCTSVLLTARQRRLLGTALGLGLTMTSTAMTSTGSGAWASTPPVMHVVGEPIDAPPPTSGTSPAPPSTETTSTTVEVMTLITPEAQPPPTPSSNPDPPAPPPASPSIDPGPDLGPDAGPASWPSPEPTWTIRPGDHLWGISEAVLAATGIAPTDADVSRYLQRLLDDNRSILVVPGNADLVYPGQVFTLPAST